MNKEGNTKNSKQKEIINNATIFADKEIRPFAGEFDKNEEIPYALIKKMAAKGFLAACLPEKYGGLGLDPIHYGLFTEVIGKACCSVRTLLTVHTSLVGETLSKWGNETQKKKWLFPICAGKKIAAFALTEPNIGSNAKGIMTTYKKDGNKYIIKGKKKWISFGDIADIFIVIASNNDEITAFIIERETEGIQTRSIKGMLGGKATFLADIEFNNVQVSEENILGKNATGFIYIVNSALDFGRYSVAWGGLAIAQEALETMVMYSRNRTQFGKKICKFQLIQGIIGDAVTKVHAARALCLKAGELKKLKTHDAAIETTIAKYFTSKVAMQIASDAVQVHGANGCSNTYPVERLYREAKILEIIEGTSQIQQGIISRYGLGTYYNPPPLGG